MSQQEANAAHDTLHAHAKWGAGHFSVPPQDWTVAVNEALAEIKAIVSEQWLAQPDALTQNEITAYALALLHLRECASAAELGRLTDACDALSVTVSRLIDNRDCATQDKCESLIRFVVHAQAMIMMTEARPTGCSLVRTGRRTMRY